jgi:hypothetical protein
MLGLPFIDRIHRRFQMIRKKVSLLEGSSDQFWRSMTQKEYQSIIDEVDSNIDKVRVHPLPHFKSKSVRYLESKLFGSLGDGENEVGDYEDPEALLVEDQSAPDQRRFVFVARWSLNGKPQGFVARASESRRSSIESAILSDDRGRLVGELKTTVVPSRGTLTKRLK